MPSSFGQPPPLAGPPKMTESLNALWSGDDTSVSSTLDHVINILRTAVVYVGKTISIVGMVYFLGSLIPVTYHGVMMLDVAFIGKEIIASGALNLLVSGILIWGIGEALARPNSIISLFLSMAWFMPNPFGINNFPALPLSK
jgi:hypothetical protein